MMMTNLGAADGPPASRECNCQKRPAADQDVGRQSGSPSKGAMAPRLGTRPARRQGVSRGRLDTGSNYISTVRART
jgi:hypothetical protein